MYRCRASRDVMPGVGHGVVVPETPCFSRYSRSYCGDPGRVSHLPGATGRDAGCDRLLGSDWRSGRAHCNRQGATCSGLSRFRGSRSRFRSLREQCSDVASGCGDWLIADMGQHLEQVSRQIGVGRSGFLQIVESSDDEIIYCMIAAGDTFSESQRQEDTRLIHRPILPVPPLARCPSRGPKWTTGCLRTASGNRRCRSRPT